MSYRVHSGSPDLSTPGAPLCDHLHPDIQEAWICARDAADRTGTTPVIYDVETDRLLDAFEIEDAHRQYNDDWGDHRGNRGT